MDRLFKDLRFGVRMLVKHPSISIISVVTFGLGIGLTATVFSIINGALFRGLPFEDSDRIMWVDRSKPSENIQSMGVAVPEFLDWQGQQTVFESMAVFRGAPVNLSETEGQPERFLGGLFSAQMFDALNVQPILGRGFREGEDRPGADPVIIIGYDVWQERFDGARDVLGQTVRANGEMRTIVGVMPEGFAFPERQRIWLPLEVDPSITDRAQGPRYPVVARLRPSVSVDEAKAQMATIASRIADEFPESNEGITVTVRPFTERFVGPEIHALLYTMLGAAIGVLVIACVNVANLLLARASVRTREVAVRTALGASRGRLIQQMMSEVLVLALAGGALGIGLAYAGTVWFETAIAVDPPPFWMTFGLDLRGLLFVVAATSLAAVASGLVPALQASGTNINEALKDEGRGSSSFRTSKVSGALVVAEVAVSCGLLIAAGLMINSVARLKTVDLPFTTENIFTARINLPLLEYPDTTSRLQFYAALLPRLEAIPGVEAATLSDGLPASGNGTRVFEVAGGTYEVDADFPLAREGIVTPGYFQTFQTEVLQGRAFRVADRRGVLPVAVVNATFARTFFPDGDAMGRRIRMGRRDMNAEWLTVVGMVPDMYMEGFANNDESPAGFYIPIAQSGVANFVSIALRTQGPPTAKTPDVRAAVMSIDPNLPTFDVLAMDDVIESLTWFYRVFGMLFMAFGAAALFLAAVGLYGVMSFAVARRTHEMGIRMALGAGASQLVGLVMRKGVVQLLIGLGVGLGLAVAAAGPLQLVLFEVNARDPVVFGTVVATLAVIGLLASFVPARRITRVEPVAALTPE
ncbi:MAG: ABC transporter permease [Gemmatimonadetes bacterium]|nr:ABC transporter permease [Gemmatimonadota bacterium]